MCCCSLIVALKLLSSNAAEIGSNYWVAALSVDAMFRFWKTRMSKLKEFKKESFQEDVSTLSPRAAKIGKIFW